MGTALFYVSGPTTLYYGGTTSADVLGVADVESRITLIERSAADEVTTDADGGIAVDHVQLGSVGAVVFTLAKYDEVIYNKMRGVIRGTSVGVTAAAGQAATPGMFKRADNPITNRQLLIQGSLSTTVAGNRVGIGSITVLDCMLNPSQDMSLGPIGTTTAQRPIVLFVYGVLVSGVNTLWTFAPVT